MEGKNKMEKGNAAKKWLELVENKDLSRGEAKLELQKIYKDNIPEFAEIVVNPGCMNRCKHCIYPEDYACYNKALSVEKWKEIIDNLYEKLDFRHFIFGGRGMNQDIIDIVGYINEKYPDVRVGMIAEALGLEKFWDGIIKLKLNNLDVSIDGLKEGHDKQRNREGLFDLSVEMIKKLMDKSGPVGNGNFRKLSILSTLTSINRDEILPMIKYFNSEIGVKNFFVTPVSVFAGRPHKSLKLEDAEVVKVIREAQEFYKELEDSYVAFSCFSDSLVWHMKDHDEDLYSQFKASEDYLEFGEEDGNNEFSFFWYPVAINGCREFIVNTDGRIITGLVVAYGEVPKENVFGSVFEIEGSREEFFDSLTNAKAFDFYFNSIYWEKTD